MAAVTNALDRWWEAVLGESTDEEGGTSFDTNSVGQQSMGQQSSASTNKKIRWLLPKRSNATSHDDSLGEESDVFDFSATAGSRRDRRNRARSSSTRTQQWVSRKKKSGDGKYSGRTAKQRGTRTQQKRPVEDEVEQITIWNFFDPSLGTRAGEEVQRKDMTKQGKSNASHKQKKDDLSWPSDFEFFPDDDRNDRCSYDRSERGRDKSSWGFFEDGDSDDDITESSASLQADVWEISDLLGAESDTTGSTLESTDGHSSDDPIADLLAESSERVKNPFPNELRKENSTEFGKEGQELNSTAQDVTKSPLGPPSVTKNASSSSLSRHLDDLRVDTESTTLSTERSSYTSNFSISKLLASGPSNDLVKEEPESITKRCFPSLKRNERANMKPGRSVLRKKGQDDGTSSKSVASKNEGKSVRSDRTSSVDSHTTTQSKSSRERSSLLGHLLCRSDQLGPGYEASLEKSLHDDIHDEYTAEYVRSLSQSNHMPDSSDSFAVVRMVPDSATSGQKKSSNEHLSLSHLQLGNGNFPEHPPTNLIIDDSKLASKGPVSMYVYDSDINSTHMAVVFNNVEEKMEIRKYRSPPYPRSGEILIKVEASTVSYNDRAIRRDGLVKNPDSSPMNIPGVDVVGVIQEVSKKATLKHHLKTGDRVMAFIKWGGNSRYATVEAERVVKVRDDVDPAEAACLAETYLSAFQSLHIGQSSGVRYGSKSLANKSILILGALSAMGKAVVELAFNANAAKVFATAKPKHHDRLRSLNVRPLERNPDFWMERLKGKIDLLLIADIEAFGTSLFKALKPDGSCVFIGRRVSSDHSKMLLEGKSGLLACAKEKNDLMKRMHSYDAFESWERNTARCKNDLAHLLQLLASSAVRPLIVDRVPLERVERAQHLLDESSRSTGIFVCEPWVRAKRRALYL